MKNLVLGSLIAIAASQAAGCIITSGDDGGSGAHVAATWQLKNAANGVATACPAGFDTAALFNQAVDANDNPVSQCSTLADNNDVTCFVDLFDCAANSGVSYPLTATRYKTWIEITDHNVASIYASSLAAYLDVTNVDLTFNAQILNDGGYFQLQWDLIGASSNASLSCAQAGATGGVEAIATDITNSSNSASDQFNCEDHYGVSAGFVQGTYTVSVAALNSADQSIGTANALTNKVIQPRNAVTNLGTVQIPITGL